ncbi:hypothetical protein ACGFNU_46660 [Spirillospora sp. NPDC048911]|uniref:hypothetical protein n=1 Tax=Spirillospora sp. NPDC048911 TaxID=3364527 RepID=UPI003724A859
MFAASFQQAGFALQIPAPELYYQLLPEHNVAIGGRRGVKIKGLWYDGEALDPYRGERSRRGGRHKGKWRIHREPRDRRTVFFQDPLTHEWHELRWTGLPPVGQIPSFSDRRASELLGAARAGGLRPKTDAELLPVLLEILGARLPVDKWAGRLTRSERIDHARETAQARAAAADRPATSPGTSTDRQPEPEGKDRARQAEQALHAERRWRRERAERDIAEQTLPDNASARSVPPRLGSSYHHRNLFALPDPVEVSEASDAGGTPADPAQDQGGS